MIFGFLVCFTRHVSGFQVTPRKPFEAFDNPKQFNVTFGRVGCDVGYDREHGDTGDPVHRR